MKTSTLFPGQIIEKTLASDIDLKEKFVKILSIDGGGIRGIIPAMILNALEERLKKKRHLSECFDVMSGTSSGGLTALLLNTPDNEGKPKYKTDDVVKLYKNLGSEIFYRSFWHQMVSFNGWFSEKFSEENYLKTLEKYFSNVELKQSLTEVLIPACEISTGKTIFFKSSKAKEEEAKNFYFKDIAHATSAAPTYFKPASIKDLAQKRTYTLVDGGVAVNNPSLSAAIYGLQIYSEYQNFLIVSIGTGENFGSPEGKVSFTGNKIRTGGKLSWASDIASLMIDSGSDVVDYLLQHAFVPNKIKKYYRFQIVVDAKDASMDDTSKKNIQALEEYAAELINNNEEKLSRIVDILDG